MQRTVNPDALCQQLSLHSRNALNPRGAHSSAENQDEHASSEGSYKILYKNSLGTLSRKRRTALLSS
jgi:hypothetical protein